MKLWQEVVLLKKVILVQMWDKPKHRYVSLVGRSGLDTSLVVEERETRTLIENKQLNSE